jgi:hypothetical protein
MQLPKLERRPELDALRGLFLVWMTLTHLPTRFSDFVNQPIGFVSAAEGFVFMSALLVGRIYMRDVVENAPGVRAKLWKRSLKIYGYHLLMLALLFTVAAAYALHTHKAALNHLLNFYFAHPLVAIVGSVLLLYCPPLLDILPMYVTFLFFTPMLLGAAVKYGWRWILAASAAVWLLAQFGLRDVVAQLDCRGHAFADSTAGNGGLQPVRLAGGVDYGAVDWGAVGDGSNTAEEDSRMGCGDIGCRMLVFYRDSARMAGASPDTARTGSSTGQVAVGMAAGDQPSDVHVFYWLRRWVLPLVKIEPFLTLGKASLRVFCAHLVFVFVGLALLYQDVGEDVDGQIEQLHGFRAIALLVVTFTALILIAASEVRRRRVESAERDREELTGAERAPVVR